ncbi:MAG: histidine kinase dimerization/phospho-acceptor domain-containing protein [Emticicia sp.]|nr:histidine kinase dimerization/phospho-acceptor domain-containing protein [Emticicia sp.]
MKKSKNSKSIISNPNIYALSLAVYCTAWTFYGSLGRASTEVAKEEEISLNEVVEILKKLQELKLLTEQLQTANEQLKSMDKFRDDFLATVMHEIRTPLTSIKSLSEILYDNIEHSERQHFLCLEEIIEDSIESIEQLAKDKGIFIKTKIDRKLTRFESDRDRIMN